METANAGSTRPVRIVGGGMTGLFAAYLLARDGRKVELYERSERLGGLLRSERTEWGLVENAANAFLATPRFERLCAELGVELLPARKQSRARYIFRDGRSRRWPLGFGASLRVGLFILRRAVFRSGGPRPLETIEAWASRTIGAEALRYLVAPALQGIYAGDVGKLSASLILGRFFPVAAGGSTERSPDSAAAPAPMRGRFRGSVSPRGGMQELVDALARGIRAHGGAIHLGREAPPAPASTNANEARPPAAAAPEYYVCLPPPAAAAFFSAQRPALAESLRRIEMLGLVSITAFFERSPDDLVGFGMLFPRGEGVRALGVLANDCIFDGRATEWRSETWIFGGALDPEALALGDEALLERLARDRAVAFRGRAGAERRPRAVRISRSPAAIPHYTVGLEGLVAAGAFDPSQGVLGTYLGDLGMSRVLDRIARALGSKL